MSDAPQQTLFGQESDAQTAATPAVSPPVKRSRKPAHGQGRLNIGNPGNKGSNGRPPSEIRRRMRELSWQKGLPLLESLLAGYARYTDPETGQTTTIPIKGGEIIQAIKLLFMIGVGENRELSTEDVRHKLGLTLDVLRDELESQPELLARVMGLMRHIWKEA
jgi:hypothetical protein